MNPGTGAIENLARKMPVRTNHLRIWHIQSPRLKLRIALAYRVSRTIQNVHDTQNSRENLKTIWLEGEMLPNWAQLLDLAARLCPVSEETRGWFSRLRNSLR